MTAAWPRYVVFLSTFIAYGRTYHAYGDLRGDGMGLWTRCGRHANGGAMAEADTAALFGKPCKTCFGKDAQ